MITEENRITFAFLFVAMAFFLLSTCIMIFDIMFYYTSIENNVIFIKLYNTIF